MRSGGRDRHRRISLAAALVGVVALIAGGLTAMAVTSGLPRSLGAPVAGPLASLPATSACADAGACDLYAKPGTATAGSASVNFWGFTLDNSVASELAGYVDVTTGPVNTIIMNTTQTVTLTLHNALPAGNLSLEFPAKVGVPDATGAPVGGTATYTLSGLAPGTYVYEAGPTVNQARQLSMGLSGLIIVRPADYVAGSSQSAYGGANGAFDQEALVVATELDPTFTAAPLANDVDDYTPRAFFLNGKAHPATDDIGVEAGQHVLMHMANLGIRDRALGLVNERMTLIGDDSAPVAHPTDIATKLLTPGEVSDVVTLVDAGAAIGQQFALLDYGRHLHNSGDNPSLTGLGGMLTFLDVVAIPGPAPAPGGPVAHVSVVAPATSDGDVTGNETVSVTYDGPVSNAYWFVDDITAPNPLHSVGTASGDYAISNGDILNSLPPGGSGDHVIWIQPYDGTNPGTPSGAAFTLSLTGPIVGALSIDPAYTNLTTAVNHAGANPAGADPSVAPTDIIVTGSAEPSLVDWTVDQAEICTADPGTTACGGIPLAVGAPTAPSFTYPLSANIAATNPAIAALSDGPHTLYIHSHEQPGAGGGTARWGASAQIVLTIDKTNGPTTSAGTWNPNPAGIGDNPGNINFLESTRFSVHLHDDISPIAGAELFLYSPPAAGEVGTGSQLRPVAGNWLAGNDMDAYIDVPVAELQSNPQGTIDVYVEGQDAAGNWGTPVDYQLQLDKTRPTIVSASVASGVITVHAIDPPGSPAVQSNIVTIEYQLNLGPESAAGAEACLVVPCLVDVAVASPSNDVTVVLPAYTDPGGVTQILVRVKDGAGNVSDDVSLTP